MGQKWGQLDGIGNFLRVGVGKGGTSEKGTTRKDTENRVARWDNYVLGEFWDLTLIYEENGVGRLWDLVILKGFGGGSA
jgi:hypothetical protein